MSWISKLITCLAICKVKTHCYSECCYRCNICDSDCIKGNSSQMASRINSIRKNEELFNQTTNNQTTINQTTKETRV